MAQNGDITSLIAQREALKDQLKFFTEFLDGYETIPNFRQLQLRLNQIVGAFSEFNKINDDIFKLDVSGDNVNARFSILDDYIKAVEKAQKFFDKDKGADGAVVMAPYVQPMDTSASVSTAGDNLMQLNQDSVSQIHGPSTSSHPAQSFPYKPRPNFDKFDGNSLQWLTFKDSFLSWQTRILQQDVDRFNDLKSCLTGDALNKINYFHSANCTYQDAWNLLIDTYENPMFLTAHHLNALLTLPKVNSSNYKEIERLADKTNAHVASLKTLNVTLSPEMVTAILEKSLSDELLTEWRKELKNATEYPQYQSMTQFLYKTASYLSQISANNANKRPQKGNNPKRDKQEQKSTAKAFVTTSRKCSLCPEKDHPLFAYPKFKALKTTYERFNAAKEAKVCFNCLMPHRRGECKSKYLCKRCKQPHHTLLHRDKPSTNTEVNKESTEGS